VAWIKRFILFHGKRHPAELTEADVSAFLSSLALNGGIAASTQNPALSALLFSTRRFCNTNLSSWPASSEQINGPK
jgi:hypothetical protein